MAIVTQETILFNDTIWNNLCYGRPNMPEKQVYAAAQAALAHDFIMEMPQHYQTVIGDRGRGFRADSVSGWRLRARF